MTSGLYHKPMTIINEDSRVISKLEASLTDNARVVIYDRQMLIVQAIGQLERSNTNRTYSSQSKCMQPYKCCGHFEKKKTLMVYMSGERES